MAPMKTLEKPGKFATSFRQLGDLPMVTPEKADRQQARKLKSAVVLMAAAEAFSERGFHTTSMDEIAARLNVSKPTLYYYFKNKEEMLYEAVRQGLVLVAEAIDEIAQSDATGREILVAIMLNYVELSLNHVGRCTLQTGPDVLPELSRQRLRKLEREVSMRIRAVVARGVADGSIAECDPMIVVSNITGALSWINRWYRADGPDTPKEIAQRSIDALLGGLIPRTAPRKTAGNSTHRPTPRNRGKAAPRLAL